MLNLSIFSLCFIIRLMKKPDYKKPDHFARKAKSMGFPARSIFKLKELDEKFRIFRPGMRVLDLGCAPGSWMKYASQRVGPAGLVVGIDRRNLKRSVEENEIFIQKNIFELDPVQLKQKFGWFDVVLSDLSPDTIGHKTTDNLRSIALGEQAYKFAETLLKPGGKFLVKVFQGEGYDQFYKFLTRKFARIQATKPKSSRPTSREMYIYCQGFGQARLKLGLKKKRGDKR